MYIGVSGRVCACVDVCVCVYVGVMYIIMSVALCDVCVSILSALLLNKKMQKTYPRLMITTYTYTYYFNLYMVDFTIICSIFGEEILFFHCGWACGSTNPQSNILDSGTQGDLRHALYGLGIDCSEITLRLTRELWSVKADSNIAL